jgi:hypothetical protein
MFSRSKDEIHSEATKATICEAKWGCEGLYRQEGKRSTLSCVVDL